MRYKYLSLGLSALAVLSVSAPALAAPKVKSQLLSTAAADSSYQACKTLTQCADILDRHDAESYDYGVLARDFDRFGDKARGVLWQMIDAGRDGDDDAKTLANRALDMMSRSAKILPPAEQRRMVEMWSTQVGAPYSHELLARLMTANLSPMVRSTAINTLGRNDKDTDYFSRQILTETVRRNMAFPMPAADFSPLSRAVLDAPSPVLVTLMALYPPEKSAPALARVLKSGDAPSVIQAYNALFDADAEAAFKALIGTLYGLTPKDAKAAIALGALLSHRHPLREDGFYMKFASELSQDTEMSPAGRAAGFDALLRRQGQKGVPALSDTPQNRASYVLALSAFDKDNIPSSYFSVPQIIGSDNPDIWLAPLSAASKTPADIIALTEAAGNFDSPQAKKIAASAFAAQDDYRVTIAGILAKAAQAKPKDPAFTAQLNSLVNSHAITQVRAAAALGLEAAASNSPRKRVFKLQSALPRRAASLEPRSAFCKVTPMNLRDLARAMPYYDAALLPDRKSADRAFLTSGARAKNGWLAGYSRPGSGGLVLYDNLSGQGRELFGDSAFGPQAVMAVQPTAKVPLGQTASAFWIFAASIQTGESAIYRAAQSPSGTVNISRHAVLPAQPSAIKLGENGEITFAMGTVNPPLILSKGGVMRRACPSKGRSEKAPS